MIKKIEYWWRFETGQSKGRNSFNFSLTFHDCKIMVNSSIVFIVYSLFKKMIQFWIFQIFWHSKLSCFYFNKSWFRSCRRRIMHSFGNSAISLSSELEFFHIDLFSVPVLQWLKGIFEICDNENKFCTLEITIKIFILWDFFEKSLLDFQLRVQFQ